MRFTELPRDLRPNSEASGNTRSDAGRSMDHDLLVSVIERWRSASMSHRAIEEEPSYDAPLQPAAVPQAAPQAQPSALRSSLLKKPLDVLSPAPAANRFR
jgi:hypothetical protein